MKVFSYVNKHKFLNSPVRATYTARSIFLYLAIAIA